MRELTLIILSILTISFCNAQNTNPFIKNIQELKLESNSKSIDLDTSLNYDFLNVYQLKWTHIYGSYGGSGFCCGGKLEKGKDQSPNLKIPTPLITDRLIDIRNPIGQFYEIIGGKYLIVTKKYNEVQPTSAPHYITITYYYEKSK